MNARLYDPKLHRFLAPDNFIQDPSNSQNYNRYGYVWNNPLRYNDPSGEVVWAVAIGAAVGVIINGINNSSHGQPFFQGVIKSAGIGGISGALSFGAGSAVLGIGGSVLQQAGTGILLHGASAGMMSGMSSGDFWSGFVVGGVSSGVASGIGATGISNQYWMAGAQIGGATISGGFGSVLAGGNFWDGARQGFITAALNHVAHSPSENMRAAMMTGRLRHLLGPDAIAVSGELAAKLGVGAGFAKGGILIIRGKDMGKFIAYDEASLGISTLSISAEISFSNLYHTGSVYSITADNFFGNYIKFSLGIDVGISIGTGISYSKGSNYEIYGLNYNIGIGIGSIDISLFYGTTIPVSEKNKTIPEQLMQGL